MGSGRISLVRLALRNFKGVRSFELVPAGFGATVRGDNATGKTTLADAFSWLLFGKDSHGLANFELKTLDEHGVALPGLEHEVEGEFDVDGEPLVLKRIYKEKWTKRRGAAERELTGHTTDYFVDEVPVSQRDYQEKIDALIDDETFRILTDPLYFAERLHWQDRRKILFRLAGDVTDQDVIGSEERLAPLADLIGRRSVEDFGKVLAGRRRKINEQLVQIPVRIDELARSVEDEPEADVAELDRQIEAAKKNLAAAQDRGPTVDDPAAEAKAAAASLKRQIEECRALALKIRNDEEIEADRIAAQARREYSEAQARVHEVELLVKSYMRQDAELTDRMQGAADSIREISSRSFDAEGLETLCPTCGQEIEVDADAARERFAAANRAERERLEAGGKRAASEREEVRRELQDAQAALKAAKAAARDAAERYQVEKEIEIPTLDDTLDERTEFAKLTKALAAARAEAAAAAVSTERDREKARKERVGEAQAALTKALNARERERGRQRTMNRLSELKEQRVQLQREYEKLELQQHLVELFTRKRVDTIEGRVNDMFEMVEFRLFREQINGGLQECCDATYNGVPFLSLNHGARINVGLDIIETLGRELRVPYPPIWIDNAEAVTQLRPTTAQQIQLIVSEHDPELRVDYSQ